MNPRHYGYSFRTNFLGFIIPLCYIYCIYFILFLLYLLFYLYIQTKTTNNSCSLYIPVLHCNMFRPSPGSYSLYVQNKVHQVQNSYLQAVDNFPYNKPTRCTNSSKFISEGNSTCFGQFLCPSSGVFHCTHSNGICHTGLLTACKQDQYVPS